LFANRPFDWHYNRLNIPFSIFYNPSLLGNTPGFTAGIDAKHVDSANYDIRGAIVIPVSRVMEREDHLRSRGRNRHFSYANNSYRSARSAISIGGVYMSDDDYGFSTGFVTPVGLVHSGMAFDIMYIDDSPLASLHLGMTADVPRIVRGSTVHVSLRNVLVSERNDNNNFGFSVGTSGIPFSDPRMYYLPYDLFFYFHIKDGSVDRVEGMARVNIDLTSNLMSRNAIGQTVAGSIGYNFVRRTNGLIDHKFFASLGIVFIGRSSGTSILAGYGDGNEKFGAATFSTFNKDGFTGDGDLFAGLGLRETDGGQFLFNLRSGGSTIRSWVLRIDDTRGGNVKTFSGGNVVPSSIIWDGLNSRGAEVEDEIVYAKLVVKGDRRVVESDVIAIERDFGIFGIKRY
jgi:hypothetical protein